MPPPVDIQCDGRRNRSSMVVHFRVTPIAFWLVATLLVAGCASNAERIDSMATAAGLERTSFAHAGFRSLVYLKTSNEAHQPLTFFLEGDGLPWEGGMRPTTDPTARRALALELLTQTPGPVAYITRPCYHELRDEKCTSDRWTGGRYSEEIVAAMTAAVDDAARRANASDITLIGYSGGGVLAVLIAERLTNVRAVITVAANLDVEAWTGHHGYLRLSESLNPAISVREHDWLEMHYQGGRDVEVPPATTQAYFERYPSARREVIATYDHVCCWTEAWPRLLEQSRSP